MNLSELNICFLRACLNGNKEEAERFLSLGADANFKNKDGDTTLMGACFSGRTEIVFLLLEKGVDMNEQNKNGETAAMKAGHAREWAVLQVLLENKADFTLTDKDGWSVLDWAYRYRKNKSEEAFEFFYRSKQVLSFEERQYLEREKMKRLLRK